MQTAVSGVRGEVRYSYKTIGTLGGWKVSSSRQRYDIVAECRGLDSGYEDQRPLTLALHVGDVRWVWQDIQPTFNGEHMVCVVTDPPQITRDF